MGAKAIADTIGSEVRRTAEIGLGIKFKEGTWTEPATIEVRLDDKHKVLQFWAGGNEQATVRHLLNDVYEMIGRPDLIEVVGGPNANGRH